MSRCATTTKANSTFMNGRNIMNAAQIHRHAGASLHSGIWLITVMLLLALRPLSAAEIVVTLTGIVDAGWDNFPLFMVGPEVPRVKGQRDLKGQPFTVVYTFGDTKGQFTPPRTCPGSATGITGGRQALPATAVLTIGNVSFTFGTHMQNAHAGAWRSIASACSESEIDFDVNEGVSPMNNVVNFTLRPAKGTRSLAQNADWRAPVSIAGFDDNGSGFSSATAVLRTRPTGCLPLRR